jgi:hypothetical protein
VLTNLTIDKANKLYGSEAAASVMKEVGQMHQKGVWKPVRKDQLTSAEKSKVIRSLLFLKRKRDGRLKARLVADGRMQERSPEYELSAPTVATESLFLVATINAFESRHVVTVDIECAYLNADMDRTVIVEVQGQVAAILTYLYPEEYEGFEKDGKICLQLLKALYGTIEAAKLWYSTLSEYLKEDGFKANEYDQCVFNKVVRDNQVTITLHVDDLMISCVDKTCIEVVLEGLRTRYTRINVQDGNKLDYLGMLFDYSVPGVVSVSMGDMVEELVQAIGVDENVRANTPATTHLFDVDDTSPPLNVSDHKRFHSAVALALYLAKRGRPDILLAVSFLSTRVQKPTLEDFSKLKRLGGYLSSTKGLKLSLGVDGSLSIRSYVDASYGVHMDGKSHTGGTDTLGKGSYSSTSTKQQIVTKSSSEAELVGISDRLSPLIANLYFLKAQGFEVGPIQIAQDNRSTIVMANKGRPIGKRTRHIAIRHFFVKDRIDMNEVKLVNVKTEDMVADYFTKPLQGALFNKLRNMIMGIS